MREDGRYDDLAAFLGARGEALLRTAVLLAPGREGGEDLLQEALERLLRKWHRVDGDPEGYLRRIMYNRAVDGWRRRSRRPEVLGLPPDIAVADHVSRLDLRLELIHALGRLTPRQRAAIVARYWEELSEAETAAALGRDRQRARPVGGPQGARTIGDHTAGADGRLRPAARGGRGSEFVSPDKRVAELRQRDYIYGRRDPATADREHSARLSRTALFSDHGCHQGWRLDGHDHR